MNAQDDPNGLVMPLAALSAVVLCVSSVLLLARYSKLPVATPDATPVEEVKPVVRVLFGTQTGTAEKFSKQLATALNEQYGQHQSFMIEDIEEFDRDTLDSQDALFFMVATYGDGEPTDNAIDFVEWLTKKSDDVMNGDCPEILKVCTCVWYCLRCISVFAMVRMLSCGMQGKPFAVFALGNTTYENFAAPGKQVHKYLEVLGGEPLVPVGLGDDDADIEEDFATWLHAVLAAVQKRSVFRSSDAPGRSAQHTVAYEVQVLEDNNVQEAVEPRAGYVMGGNAKFPQLLPVQEVRELHGSKSERSCVHVELDLGVPSALLCFQICKMDLATGGCA